MIEDLKIQLLEYLRIIGLFLWKNTVGRIVLISGIVGLLQTLGAWNFLLNWFNKTFSGLINSINSLYYGIPIYYWLLIIVILFVLFLFSIRQYLYLRVVSGVFYDNFKNGLSKWEFGEDIWKVEYEEGKPLLSVSDSREGGISKKGFSWSDYEVSFDTKVIKIASGWIIRAENRSKCLMIQLHMEKKDRPLLRLHIKIPQGSDYDWGVVQEDQPNLTKAISLLEWIKVKMIVNGSNVDVYLNDEHAAHYFIADPLKISSEETVILKEKNEKGGVVKESTVSIVRKSISMNYSIGKIGFRCAPPEHAHFRNVRLKPLS